MAGYINMTDLALPSTSDNSERLYRVKEEILGDEDMLLYTSGDLTSFPKDSNNFQMVQELVNNAGPLPDNSAFNIQGFDENPMNQLLNKYPIDFGQLYKLESIKSDNSSQYVKYKLRDGKHSKVWECEICSKEFGHQYTLMRHLPTHTDERKFLCNTCGKAFRQMSTLSQHRAIHSAERPYVCEVCHKTFNRVSTLISHRKTHTGLKPHRCHLCNKAFHQKGNLRNHIFTHTNERPYKCDVCSKGFNQMSNLMCHKVKAHKRTDKPRYICQICGKDFQKRMGLRNHEQYQHGLQNLDMSSPSNSTTRIKYTNGVLVEPINTAAMQHALATNQTPFALLRPLSSIPVLVRVLKAGDKQMLVPATAEDLKKHGQITITSQVEESKKEGQASEASQANDQPAEVDKTALNKPLGSTVQIKIPVVATVVQRCGKDGNMCMAVESPGPNTEGTSNENYVFTTTTNDAAASSGGDGSTNLLTNYEPLELSAFANNGLENSQIQYIDEAGNLIREDDYQVKNGYDNFQFGAQQDVFSSNVQLEQNIISIQTQQNTLREIDTENVLNIEYVENNENHMFEMLEKPQVISLNETLSDADKMLYGTGIGNTYVLP